MKVSRRPDTLAGPWLAGHAAAVADAAPAQRSHRLGDPRTGAIDDFKFR